MKTVVVIPTYNEVDNLVELLSQIQSLGIDDLAVLVVDDNSPDGTGQIADCWAEKHPGWLHVIHREGKLGLASAYVTGFRRALDMGAEAVMQMDADLSHDSHAIPSFLMAIQSADLVIGSRYVAGGQIDESWGLSRRLLSAWGNHYARLVAGVDIQDATSGYRCFRTELLRRISLRSIRSNGYVFQVEMALASQAFGARIVEIPITFKERNLGRSKISLRIITEAAVRVWQLRRVYNQSRTGVHTRPERGA
jgi:dolichol-phosphate mannosyltransferase